MTTIAVIASTLLSQAAAVSADVRTSACVASAMERATAALKRRHHGPVSFEKDARTYRALGAIEALIGLASAEHAYADRVAAMNAEGVFTVKVATPIEAMHGGIAYAEMRDDPVTGTAPQIVAALDRRKGYTETVWRDGLTKGQREALVAAASLAGWYSPYGVLA